MKLPKLDTRSPSYARGVLALATALSLGGCALLGNVNVSYPRGKAAGGSPSQAQGADQATSEAGTPAPGAAENVVRYYQSLDYHNMSQYVDDSGSALQAAGISDRMLASSANPDPGWIPGWDGLDRVERHMAMLRAAIRRTWSADCEQDFAKFFGAWQEIRQAVEPDLAAIASEKSYYLAADRLREVWERVEALSVEHKANMNNELNLSMVRAELASLELDLRARTGREGLARFILHQQVLTRSRPMPEARDQALALYCTLAAETGTPNLRAIPRLRDINRLPADAVRPLIDPRHDAVVETWNEGAREWPLPNEGDREVVLLTGERAEPGKFAYVGYGGAFRADFVVKSIREKSGSTIVILSFSHPAQEQHSCKMTNNVVRIDADGVVYYEEKCKYRDVKYTYDVEATFADPLPAQLQVGDELGFYADIDKLESSNKLGGNVRYRTITAKVRGKHVREIQRDGEVVAEY